MKSKAASLTTRAKEAAALADLDAVGLENYWFFCRGDRPDQTVQEALRHMDTWEYTKPIPKNFIKETDRELAKRLQQAKDPEKKPKRKATAKAKTKATKKTKVKAEKEEEEVETLTGSKRTKSEGLEDCLDRVVEGDPCPKRRLRRKTPSGFLTTIMGYLSKISSC